MSQSYSKHVISRFIGATTTCSNRLNICSKGDIMKKKRIKPVYITSKEWVLTKIILPNEVVDYDEIRSSINLLADVIDYVIEYNINSSGYLELIILFDYPTTSYELEELFPLYEIYPSSDKITKIKENHHLYTPCNE